MAPLSRNTVDNIHVVVESPLLVWNLSNETEEYTFRLR